MKHIVLILVLLFSAQAAQAHFILDAQNREIDIVKADDGSTNVILRFPLTLAYANELAQRAPGAEFSAPFMQPELVQGVTYYRLDTAAILENPDKFTDFLLRDFRFSLFGATLTLDAPQHVVIDTHATEEAGRTIDPGLAASTALLADTTDIAERPYIGDALVVISFSLPGVSDADPLEIKLLSAPFPVPDGMFFETRITDHRDGSANLLAFQGTGFAPVTLAGGWVSSFLHFVKQGAYHILIGFDHVLYVLCLVAAAASLRLLVLAVTGFTVGHSVTLAAGAFGFVPQGAWFIPFVELLVAASILLMGVLILLRRSGKQGFWLAAGIGLLHGFGFSFMLGAMLGSTRDGLIPALAGFNIGVEIGQLIIVLPAFALLAFVASKSLKMDKALRYGLAGFASIMAIIMLVERTGLLQEALISETAQLNTIYSIASITQTARTGA